jgi:hypothetical protein
MLIKIMDFRKETADSPFGISSTFLVQGLLAAAGGQASTSGPQGAHAELTSFDKMQ